MLLECIWKRKFDKSRNATFQEFEAIEIDNFNIEYNYHHPELSLIILDFAQGRSKIAITEFKKLKVSGIGMFIAVEIGALLKHYFHVDAGINTSPAGYWLFIENQEPEEKISEIEKVPKISETYLNCPECNKHYDPTHFEHQPICFYCQKRIENERFGFDRFKCKLCGRNFAKEELEGKPICLNCEVLESEKKDTAKDKILEIMENPKFAFELDENNSMEPEDIDGHINYWKIKE